MKKRKTTSKKRKVVRKKKYLIGMDIGGTKILTGLLDERFNLKRTCKVKVDAAKGERKFLNSIFETIQTVLDEEGVAKSQLQGVGIGCPGMIDLKTGVIKLSPNIAFLKDYPLRSRIQNRLKVPVALENDVNAGIYGEQQFGAAKGFEHVIGIFLGTGVGGGLVLNGKIYHGCIGGAGEIGHTFLSVPFSSPQERAKHTVEGSVGRLAISSEAVLLAMKQQAPNLYEAVGYDAKKIKSKALVKSVRAGDVAIKSLIEEKAHLLGIAMANLVNILNPELIVLGGGMVEAMSNLILPTARNTMKQYAMGPLVRNVKVVPAKLKDYSIVMGGAKLAQDLKKR